MIQDIKAIADHIGRAKETLDRKDVVQLAVWDELDQADARLQGLSSFLF